MNNTNKNDNSAARDFSNLLRGLLMGAADIVPGVSGGTVALILGIYQRLVAAISHFDLTLIRHLKQRKWGEAANHIDLRFLVALGIGILTGIVSLASITNYLLTQDHTRPFTLAAFFGLIIASCILVARMIKLRNSMDLAAAVVLGLIAALFAYWLTGLLSVQMAPSYGYVFICGTIAICAMILPGISGSFILLLMGMYVYITGIIKELKSGNITSDYLLTVLTFAAGCAIGLMLFSKLLRWLLAEQNMPTMSVMCGFMVGSLRKLWPIKNDVTLDHLDEVGLSVEKIAAIKQDPSLIAEQTLNHRAFENAWPQAFSTDVLLIFSTMLAACLFVFLLDRFSGGSKQTPLEKQL